MKFRAPHIDLPEVCVYTAVERAARKVPDKVAIELQGFNHVTFSQLMARANALAAMLIAHGARHGDRVAYMSKNRCEIMDVFLACSRVGAIFVPFVDSLRGSVLKGMVDLSEPLLFIAEETCRDAIEEVWRGKTIYLAEPQLADSPPWMRDVPDVQLPDPPPVEDLCLILYTSGTTGQSKGVLWTSGTVLLMAASSNALNGMTGDDVFHTALPAAHGNALMLSVLNALMIGATVVLARRFSASRFEAELIEARAAITNLLGSMSNLVLAQDRSPVPVTTLKKAFVIPLAPNIAKEIEERFHCQVCSGYGLADVGLPIWTGPEFPDGSCGQLLTDFWEGKILDDSGRDVLTGEVGELWVRSHLRHLSAQGFWRMPEATAARYKDGWIATGDLFRRDAEGWFYFMDRGKDTIRRRGENVSSQEVEAVILEHALVIDCAVYAVPSEMSEDEVMVSAVLRPGARLEPLDLIKSIEKRLPYFAVPRFVRFVSELPRTDTQKVQKAGLKNTGVTPDTWDLDKSGYKVAR